jgi:hypothetical protein
MLLWWYKFIFKSYCHLFRESGSSHDVVTRLGNSVRFQAEKTFSSLHQNALTRCSSHQMKCVICVSSDVSLAA